MFRKWGSLSSVVLRCGLGLGFLSAVADRLGLWGPLGEPNVEWGNFSRFLEYTHTLNWYVPAGMIPALGVIATGAESLFVLLLLLGWHTRATALLSGLLLVSFGVAMTLALGVKAPLNFAVLTGVGGAFLLATCERFPFSVDELLFRWAHVGGGRRQHELENESRERSGTPTNRIALLLLLAVSSVPVSGSANDQDGARRTRAGTVTRLMTRDLPDVPGKEGMVEIVDFAPGEASQVHRHNADLFVYVLEGSIVTQLKGGSPQTVHAGDVFYESPTDIHSVSRNASDTQPAKLLVFYVKAKGAPPTVILDEGDR
jgi:quercetin dioxygenase-like cupin family protein/uncharacterized membrane protein YphA (DoxX/SURF4 family)